MLAKSLYGMKATGTTGQIRLVVFKPLPFQALQRLLPGDLVLVPVSFTCSISHSSNLEAKNAKEAYIKVGYEAPPISHIFEKD